MGVDCENNLDGGDEKEEMSEINCKWCFSLEIEGSIADKNVHAYLSSSIVPRTSKGESITDQALDCRIPSNDDM